VKPLPKIVTHYHPDGTVVATATISDGRVLRVVAEAPPIENFMFNEIPINEQAYTELCKAIRFQEGAA
jgi:hypothetical protein